ncbi:hypothetical protein [Halalkalicoccus jeotgali]|uniref:Uncharacterized protein n=1 Tax=Halalkalicoccus jeotgali (strain DSM 18796 / CECT 7217 / JCM 14584 / KCTC 4019 / B3) TaxID=795797 RepID=D8J9X5_HALJB|nr:hypothetical protein [Halalkalicoccus jeotgali]ADJ14497.1 hypothetical protein HacjB3_05530 [Halalkalicoccus jeotgali B3]ELY40209.1 hypothetical protein C497_03895 [Halalkalicoccus jeotgali B3]
MSQYDERDDWGASRGTYGPRDYPPRHRSLKLYHKMTSEDGVTIFDPNGIGGDEGTWIAALPGVATSLPDAR